MAISKILEKVEVEYRGQKLMVWPWVNWIGTDSHGSICGYELEPVKFKYPDDTYDCSWDISKKDDRWQHIKTGYAYEVVEDWEQTLVNIKEAKEQ